MFYWPQIELTEYERNFVRLYEDGNKPGVLRRLYRVILNNFVNPNIQEVQRIHLTSQMQVSRRARVFALSFAGDCGSWRLHISKANGDRFTATNPGVAQVPSSFPTVATTVDAPLVSAMCPGSFESAQSALGVPPPQYNPEADPLSIVSRYRLPLIIDPNWQLEPNEQLIFEGFPIVENPIVLEIGIHVWEFPGWGC